ncbi:4-(cytidine 5'-diphospho)-2-C-methyl-D-erythritol kinase [Clostridium sp. MSJ-11]|uniref:4-diphosphocytidyl-2-C-methyl-D-erythritol kinase n=1 Tax=Clostridium mobile TaxID=2841512 RepID=A0ABS6ELQ8_9CLOT|nr:4-(cytidine 5'-diphospho)-2-C-methyl-D-erythritol kinase [Clostridium mobile]MBU5486154.1 4-(cytidine 5'-diphospho)-2-C-methyl-D-erythritol kinase [Clostridium mobile]
MKRKAYAKVNLSLDVLGRKENGYHLLSMIMQCIDLYDTIEIKEINNGIKVNCNKINIPTDKRNLAYRAADMFIEKYKINKGVEIYIEKNIPTEAGLGGGSSNAAIVLKMMRDMFKPQINDEELAMLGEKLGADVPFFIYGGTALCEGIGEIITPLEKFKNHILLLVKPNFGVSTKDVYEEIDKITINDHPNMNRILNYINENNLEDLSKNMINVLELVTLDKYPELLEIKRDMKNLGSIGTLMSGSGSTIFGFFENYQFAERCYNFMKDKYDEVFLSKTI